MQTMATATPTAMRIGTSNGLRAVGASAGSDASVGVGVPGEVEEEVEEEAITTWGIGTLLFLQDAKGRRSAYVEDGVYQC